MEDEIDVSVAAKMFNRGEEEYEHMLMDLRRLSLCVPVVETGKFAKFSQGEEDEAHLELDEMLEPRKISYPTGSTTKDYDDDLSLMEWDGDMEPVRSLKRKRNSGHRSRGGNNPSEHAHCQHKYREYSQQSIQLCSASQVQQKPVGNTCNTASIKNRGQAGVNKIQQIPPEVKTKIKRGKYLLVGSTVPNASIDHPRMAMLNRGIMKAALVIQERSIAMAEEQKLNHMYNTNITLLN